MNILLLGATGYLGSNIAKRLIEDGNRIMCVVRKTSDTSRIVPLGVQLVSDDIGGIELYLKHNSVDWIINSIGTYKPNDTLYADLLVSNIFYPLNVLNLAVKYGVRGFMTIGTGLPSEFNHYSFTKHEFAEFGKYLSIYDGIDFAELKLEMFYGGCNEPDDRFINSVKQKLFNNEDVLLTDGLQKRDIIRVEDVISIISKLISSNYVRGFMSLPIGTGESHSIREIVSFMKNELTSSSNLLFGAIPSRNGEPDTLADTEWYKDIGFRLKYSFFEGLKAKCME